MARRRRGLDLHVEIEPGEAGGLAEVSYAQCGLIRSVSGRRLVHRLGTIDAHTSQTVERVIRALLGYR